MDSLFCWLVLPNAFIARLGVREFEIGISQKKKGGMWFCSLNQNKLKLLSKGIRNLFCSFIVFTIA